MPVISDNQKYLENQVLRDIFIKLNIKKTFITTQHAASNGLVDRNKRKIFEILRHLAGCLHETWGIGIIMLQPSLTGLSVRLQEKHLITSCIV